MPTIMSSNAPVSGGSTPVGRLMSSDTIPAGGFAPGTILQDRYRIIGLLGRGGMGEVYRADDLKLGQPVALKFLPRALVADAARRERFFAEVRITRQLAHPNICRVYDVAEYDGQLFLSMEYIDGEDLSSLLKRIGYLSSEKASDIGRQLAAGLAAAHERGVLHRDLKPANIMIDGHGRARITDFGLAIAADDEAQAKQISGTPAYMAPEQLEGKGTTVQSDIYSLGLVLYEIYSGKRTFEFRTLEELRELHQSQTPKTLSEVRAGIDPLVERLIARCLDRDPAMRPKSAAQLVLALPGGDPLAAALAAGETPSPEMVAASGMKEGLRPAVAVAMAVLVVVGVLAATFLNERTLMFKRIAPGKAPEVLADRARELINKVGYAEGAVDKAHGFNAYEAFLDYIERTDKSDGRWNRLKSFTPVVFWYRQSPAPLMRSRFGTTGIQWSDPQLQVPGEVLVRLDNEGRLRTFQAIPPEVEKDAGPHPDPDWALLFTEAGLNSSDWKPASPTENPASFADTRAAWEGSLPEAPDIQVRIEAAAYRGKPVNFEFIGPWTTPLRSVPPPATTGEKAVQALIVILLLLVFGGAAFLARRNYRLGRGDKRGATRIAVWGIGVMSVSWLLAEHHVANINEVTLIVSFTGEALFLSGLLWILYMALEPLVRRSWPQTMVSWARLLSGAWRDPLVGRDILAGCAFGAISGCLVRLSVLAPSWFGYPEAMPLPPEFDALSGSRSFVATVASLLSDSVLSALALLFFVFLMRLLLRNEWVAAAVVGIIITLPAVLRNDAPWVVGVVEITYYLLFLFASIRFGILALVVTLFVGNLLVQLPLTFDSADWYSGASYGALLIVGVLTAYACHTSLGGRRLFEDSTESRG